MSLSDEAEGRTMSGFFTLLLLLSLLALPVGLANPAKVLPWSRTKTRRRAAITYGSVAAISLVMAGITAPETPQEQVVTPAPEPMLDGTPTPTPDSPSPTPTPEPPPAPTMEPTVEAPTPEPAVEAPPPEPEAAPADEPASNCDPAYPDSCIPPPPPDLDCGDIGERDFTVLAPDPHGFDREGDGIGCEG